MHDQAFKELKNSCLSQEIFQILLVNTDNETFFIQTILPPIETGTDINIWHLGDLDLKDRFFFYVITGTTLQIQIQRFKYLVSWLKDFVNIALALPDFQLKFQPFWYASKPIFSAYLWSEIYFRAENQAVFDYTIMDILPDIMITMIKVRSEITISNDTEILFKKICRPDDHELRDARIFYLRGVLMNISKFISNEKPTHKNTLLEVMIKEICYTLFSQKNLPQLIAAALCGYP